MWSGAFGSPSLLPSCSILYSIITISISSHIPQTIILTTASISISISISISTPIPTSTSMSIPIPMSMSMSRIKGSIALYWWCLIKMQGGALDC